MRELMPKTKVAQGRMAVFFRHTNLELSLWLMEWGGVSYSYEKTSQSPYFLGLHHLMPR
jgi:hypothetical protein